MAVPSAAAAFVGSAPCFAAFRNTKVTSTLLQGTKYIGTHNGSFHCDEALAVSLLKLLPQFAGHDILRTRDEALLKQCDAVVDVGGIFDAATHRFDHHQKSFQGTFSDQFHTRLSSAGLVYKHFGKDIIQVLAQASVQRTLDDATVEMLHVKTYKNFIEHIDGIDNGVEVARGGGPLNYQVSTSLSSRVGYLNPSWNEDQSADTVNRQFQQAMYLTVTEFTDSILSLLKHWLPARSIVEEAVKNRFQTHPSGEILHLPQYCPWKSHLYDIEKDLLIDNQIKFVLYDDQTGNMTRVQAVNVESASFALRLGLREPWRGLRDEELSQVAGIPGCTFVHAAGFIGGNRTYEGALAMAVNSLEAGAGTE